MPRRVGRRVRQDIGIGIGVYVLCATCSCWTRRSQARRTPQPEGFERLDPGTCYSLLNVSVVCARVG